MSLVRPVFYPADRIGLAVLNGILPPPTMEWNFARKGNLVNTQGNGSITYSGGDNGTYFDSAGILQTSGADAARFDYDPTTLAPLGLLLEEQRVWRMLHNRDWTDAVYDTVTNVTAVKDATGLTGDANSASTLTATDANGVIRQSITLGSAARTFSVYVKRKTGTSDIDITDDGGSNYTTLTGLSATAWTRHTITRTQANPDVGFRIVASGDAIEVDFGGVEDGTFETSPVSVGAAAVTRTVDVATMTGSNLSGWFNAIQGTFFAEHHTHVIAANEYIVLSVSDGGNDELTALKVENDEAHLHVRNAPSEAHIGNAGVISADEAVKSAAAYAANDIAMATNGSALDTEGTVVLPTGISQMDLGAKANGNEQFSGHIERIIYWPKRLPNWLLQSLSGSGLTPIAYPNVFTNDFSSDFA